MTEITAAKIGRLIKNFATAISAPGNYVAASLAARQPAPDA
jgi:hypothetical protein